MHIKAQLRTVADLFATSRGVGHTFAQATGYIGNTNVVVLVAEGTHRELPPTQRKTLSQNLAGIRKPIVVEHHLVHQLCAEAVRYIDYLEEKNSKLEGTIKRIKELTQDF